jgi:hypothetical protein
LITFFLNWLPTMILLISSSWIAEITGMDHWPGQGSHFEKTVFEQTLKAVWKETSWRLRESTRAQTWRRSEAGVFREYRTAFSGGSDSVYR